MIGLSLRLPSLAVSGNANQVATPVCALDDSPETPYTTEQEIAFADITCATEGATIYVKVDDGEWTEWAEA